MKIRDKKEKKTDGYGGGKEALKTDKEEENIGHMNKPREMMSTI